MTICHISALLFNNRLKLLKKLIKGERMLEFSEIMSRLKRSLHEESGERILDKDLAKALGFTPSYYAVIKRREKIPYQAIALFAHEKNLSLNWIFFNKSIP
jgi:hypothetical protein